MRTKINPSCPVVRTAHATPGTIFQVLVCFPYRRGQAGTGELSRRSRRPFPARTVLATLRSFWPTVYCSLRKYLSRLIGIMLPSSLTDLFFDRAGGDNFVEDGLFAFAFT